MLSRSPSWNRIENSFSPISFARPSVAATLPAVRDASEVASTLSRSPFAAICWPFLSTRNTIFAFASIHNRARTALMRSNSSSYKTKFDPNIVMPAGLRSSNIEYILQVRVNPSPAARPSARVSVTESA